MNNQYIQHGIEKLSKNQVSKLLNGHPTRIKAGKHHSVHLSQEHSKKLHRAHNKNMGLTVQLDPYAISHNQHLRKDVGMRGKGTGTDLGATLGHVVGKVAEAGGTRAVDAIAGTDKDSNEGAYDNSMVASGLKKRRGIRGRGTGTDLGATLGHTVGKVAEAGGTRAVDAIAGTDKDSNAGAYDNSMVASGLKKRRGRGVKVNVRGHIGIPSSFRDPISGLSIGGNVNRLKKAQRWTGYVSDVYQGVAHAVKPMAQPIIEAGTDRMVEMINPETPEDYLNNYVGYGVKKRGRPRKMHGSGTPPTMMFNGQPIPPEEALRIQQEMNRAIKRDQKRDEKHGGSVNRLKKAQRWTGYVSDVYQGVAHAVKPMAVPIIQAGTDRMVEMINPESTEDYLNNYVGYGMKKRGRPRKMCGGLVRLTPEQQQANEVYMMSSGQGIKKRGRPRKMKGSALYSAGY